MIFLNDKQGCVTTIKIFTPDKMQNYLKTLLPSNLYLHMNISSLSYHIDDLNLLMKDCQFKPKAIGISECRLKKSFDAHSNYYKRLYNRIHNYRIFKR